ncbi:MAG: hypothetical protein CMF98_04625 [Candidatus Marinimicrobia bacterium]|nr:hypothetical protein [Candidatus Neomarinimicrobiota bacterium]OUW50283.1 MAG: hypothetical protein CBD50_03220 [bacterium TMED190]
MKFIFTIIIIIVFNSLSFSQPKKNNDNSGPFFYLNLSRYPTNNIDSTKIDLHINIPYSSIQFLKKKDNFEANYELTYTIQSQDDIPITRLSKEYIAKVDDFNDTYSSLITDMVKETIILFNENSKLFVELMDLDTRKIFRKQIDISLEDFKKNDIISDLILIDINKKNSLFENGFPIIPPMISDIDSSINIFYEAISRNTSFNFIYYRISSLTNETIISDSIQIANTDLVFNNILNIPISDKIKSNFNVQLSYERIYDDSSNEEFISSITIKSNFMGMTSFVNDIDEAIEQLRYIAFTDELKKIFKNKNITKEEKLKEFWEKRDPTPETKQNELMNEYYRRVSFANNQFQTWQKGWKTSMGMIFILFGPPDNIEKNMSDINGREYQRWNYIRINRSFTFLDYNGFGEFELLDPYNSTYGTRWR